MTGETPPEASDIVDEGLTIPDYIAPRIATAIEKCMAPARKQRPQSITEFLSLIAMEPHEHPQDGTSSSKENTVIQKRTDHQYLSIDVKGILFKMCFVEAGTFMMGATSEQEHEAYSDEKSNKRVDIQNFYLGETTVTRKLWNAIMGNYQSESKEENLPIEWEYAARGGNQSKGYKYAGSNSIDEVAWYDGNSEHHTHPVALKDRMNWDCMT